MEQVVERAKEYIANNPLDGVKFNFAGPGYFNARWNQEMFNGMMLAVAGAALIILFLLTLNFRSQRWGAIGILPLAFTILASYGFLGLFRVPFTMPIEVLEHFRPLHLVLTPFGDQIQQRGASKLLVQDSGGLPDGLALPEPPHRAVVDLDLGEADPCNN